MSENQFEKRQTPWAPMQPAGLMNDPVSLMLMLYGPQFINQLAGPGQFLPNQIPGQNVLDQFDTFKYKRQSAANLLNASNMGDDAVSTKVLGLMSMITGQNPSQLNRDQAQMAAGLINSPIAKMALGMAVGPENLEGVLFGRRGDPSALAATANKIGAFRRDPMGARQMTAEGLQSFTRSLHETMYGQSADVDDMRGLMAGQSGQLMDYLFQRGQLPQSVGALSPADRVKLISKSRDAATIELAAQEFGMRDLMRDDSFARKGPEEQKQILRDNMGTYRQRIKDTFAEIDTLDEQQGRLDPAERDKRMSALEGKEEFKMLAANVDGKRVGQTLKDYAGSVRAIQEIFGDNGRTDAPMSALISALEQLTGGAMQKMNPQKVEGILREMRIAAKQTGVGLEQMLGMTGEMMGMGKMMGVSEPRSLEATKDVLTMLQAMEGNNAFADKRFGALTKEEAMKTLQQRTMRGKASSGSKTLAAINRAVTENPDQYKDTILEKMMEAYNNPESGGKFTFEGKDYDLAEMSGRLGATGLGQLAGQNKMNMRLLETYFMDPGTEEFARNANDMRAQQAELKREATMGMIGDVRGFMTTPSGEAVNKFLGAGDKDRNRVTFSERVSEGLTKELLNEGAKKEAKDRPAFLQERAPAVIREALAAQNPELAKDPKALDAAVNETMTSMFGSGDAQRSSFAQLVSGVNAYLTNRTGLGITGNAAIMDAIPEQEKIAAGNRELSQRMSKVARGHESSVGARLGELFERIGSGEEVDMGEAIKQVTGIIPMDKLESAAAEQLVKYQAYAAKTYKDAKTDDTPEGKQKRDRAERMMVGMLNSGDKDLVSAAAEDMTKLLLGDNVDADIIKQVQDVAGSEKGSDDSKKKVAALQEALKNNPGASQVVEYAEALRDSRSVDMKAQSDAPPDSAKKQTGGAGTQADGSTSPQQKVSATPENESAAETYRRFNEIKDMQLGQGGGGGGENKVTLSGELRLIDMQRAVIAAVGDTGTQIPLGGRIAGMA